MTRSNAPDLQAKADLLLNMAEGLLEDRRQPTEYEQAEAAAIRIAACHLLRAQLYCAKAARIERQGFHAFVATMLLALVVLQILALVL